MRLTQIFAQGLVLALKSGMSERVAINVAAGYTGNSRFQELAGRAISDLESGEFLTTVIKTHFPYSKELSWRIKYISENREQAFMSIEQWCDHLEARAYRAEQMFSQIVSTMMILILSAWVAIIAIVLFSRMVGLIELNMW